MIALQLKHTGDCPGYARTYYRSTNTRRPYTYCSQQDFPDRLHWYLCSTQGEPEDLLQPGTLLELDDGTVLHVNDNGTATQLSGVK
jgi:hypothetical protein